MTIEVFIPRLMDAAQQNPQNNNARMLVRRWPADNYGIRTLSYGEPDPRVKARSGVHIARLWRRHAWPAHLFLQYLRPYSAVFYPGVTPADIAGVRGRRLLGLRGPIIATLEGLVGDNERERFYSSTAGHDVFCQPVTKHELKRCDFILQVADHVIAISPFLARMGRARYGDKFSVLPLGVDRGIFHPAATPLERSVKTVVSAGRVTARKRPDVLLDLAERFPATNFKWFGEGDRRQALIAQAVARNISNIDFPGSLPPERLADELRAADIFVMPSLCEGVPKVTQEAAACGVPVIVFGFYEPSSVEHGRNGFIVWSDAELEMRIAQLLGDAGLRRDMGRVGLEIASKTDWDKVAPQWERIIRDRVELDRATGSVQQ